MNVRLLLSIVLGVAWGLPSMASPVFAHGLEIEAELDGDMLRGLVAFDDGVPCAGARVTLRWTEGHGLSQTLSQTRTDDEGRFRFLVTQHRIAGKTFDVLVYAHDELGHRTQTIRIAEAPARTRNDSRWAKSGAPVWIRLAIGLAAIAAFAVARLAVKRASGPGTLQNLRR